MNREEMAARLMNLVDQYAMQKWPNGGHYPTASSQKTYLFQRLATVENVEEFLRAEIEYHESKIKQNKPVDRE
jgi:hypothetical protein